MQRAMRVILALLVLLGATGSCSDDDDKNGVQPDTKITTDKGVPETALQDIDPTTVPNSGATCSSTCKNSMDICAFITGAGTGMCLMQCTPGDTCHVPTGPYASKCDFGYTSGTKTGFVCGWYCEYKGMSYNCPNSTDYNCKALNASEPSIKLCIPK